MRLPTIVSWIISVASAQSQCRRTASGALAWGLFLLVCGHSALCAVTASQALDWARGTREQPSRMLLTLAVGTAVVAVLAVILSGTIWRPTSDSEFRVASIVFVGVIAFGASVLGLGTRNIQRMTHAVVGAALGAGAVAFPLGFPGPAALITAGVVMLAAGFLTVAAAFSVWLLNAVYELDGARETRARLVVAEERLRFGRDLHDVMGRNLPLPARLPRGGGADAPARRLHETVRRWCLKFGQGYADGLRRRRPRPGDKRHLDEVFVKINSEQKYLWRAVDQDGNVLDILVQSRRDKAAARRFFRRLMKTSAVPRGDRHGQAPLLRRGPPRGHALGGAPFPQGPEQPGGEQPPANKAARTRDERASAASAEHNASCPHSAASHPTSAPGAI